MKRFIAIFMTLCLLLGMSSVSAFAAADEYTKLDMHFDKEGFIDEAGHDVTLVGAPSNCYISKENSKNGGASLYVNDGTNNYLQIKNSDDFNFDKSAFTIEMWVYFDDSIKNHKGACFIGNQDQKLRTGWAIGYNNLPNEEGLYYYHNGGRSWDKSSMPSLNSWHHIAIVKKEMKMTTAGIMPKNTAIFIDGKKIIEDYESPVQATQKDLYIGKGGSETNNNYSFTGYLDDIKISKGIAKYTDDFTPEIQKSKLSVLLNEGEIVQLSTSFNLENNKNFTWTSTNEAVATVDSNGKVIAIGVGDADIYAERADGTFKECIPVKVVEGIADELRLAVHLKVDEKAKLYLTDDPSQVRWNSMDESIATVSTEGQVTGVKKGLAIVKAELDGQTYQIYVRVNG